jgi:hypothetical protein
MKVNVYAAIGRSGQLMLNGEIPWSTSEASAPLIRFLIQHDLPVVAYDYAQCLTCVRPKRPVLFRHDQKPLEMIQTWKKRYYDKDLWILGPDALTYSLWAPHVDGRVILDMQPYDGPADSWFQSFKATLSDIATPTMEPQNA